MDFIYIYIFISLTLINIFDIIIVAISYMKYVRCEKSII